MRQKTNLPMLVLKDSPKIGLINTQNLSITEIELL